MKKGLFLTLFLIYCSNSYAVNIRERWNPFFKKEVILTCEAGSSVCNDFCGFEDQCLIPETPCQNCIGTSVYLTHFFEQLGKTYVPTNESFNVEDFYKFLKTKLFASFNSKTIYNHLDEYDNDVLRKKFKSLCQPIEDEFPLVFFEMDKVSKRLGKIKYVACNENENVYISKMTDDGDVLINFNEAEDNRFLNFNLLN